MERGWIDGRRMKESWKWLRKKAERAEMFLRTLRTIRKYGIKGCGLVEQTKLWKVYWSKEILQDHLAVLLVLFLCWKNGGGQITKCF